MVVKMNLARKKPFGFICFKTHELAESAIGTHHSTDPFGSGENIHVCWAQTKHERSREQKQNQSQKNDKNLYTRNLKLETTSE